MFFSWVEVSMIHRGFFPLISERKSARSKECVFPTRFISLHINCASIQYIYIYTYFSHHIYMLMTNDNFGLFFFHKAFCNDDVSNLIDWFIDSISLWFVETGSSRKSCGSHSRVSECIGKRGPIWGGGSCHLSSRCAWWCLRVMSSVHSVLFTCHHRKHDKHITLFLQKLSDVGRRNTC